MIDLNYGENYKEEIDLKHEIEEKIAQSLGVPKNHVLLNYGSNRNLILVFSAFSLKSLVEKGRKVKVLLDFPNYFFRRKRQFFCEAGRRFPPAPTCLPAGRGFGGQVRRLAAGQRRFRFLDLCIRFGKIISKVCGCFNSAAI